MDTMDLTVSDNSINDGTVKTETSSAKKPQHGGNIRGFFSELFSTPDRVSVTPYLEAFRDGDYQFVSKAIERGLLPSNIDIMSQDPETGNCFLHFAAKYSFDPRIGKYFLALVEGHPDFCKALQIKNKNNNNPLVEALLDKRPENQPAARAMIASGAARKAGDYVVATATETEKPSAQSTVPAPLAKKPQAGGCGNDNEFTDMPYNTATDTSKKSVSSRLGKIAKSLKGGGSSNNNQAQIFNKVSSNNAALSVCSYSTDEFVKKLLDELKPSNLPQSGGCGCKKSVLSDFLSSTSELSSIGGGNKNDSDGKKVNNSDNSELFDKDKPAMRRLYRGHIDKLHEESLKEIKKRKPNIDDRLAVCYKSWFYGKLKTEKSELNAFDRATELLELAKHGKFPSDEEIKEFCDKREMNIQEKQKLKEREGTNSSDVKTKPFNKKLNKKKAPEKSQEKSDTEESSGEENNKKKKVIKKTKTKKQTSENSSFNDYESVSLSSFSL